MRLQSPRNRSPEPWRLKSEKTGGMKRQMELLQQRYDLRNETMPGVNMSDGKAVRCFHSSQGEEVDLDRLFPNALHNNPSAPR